MKPQKNKIVFVSVLIGVVLFIVAYSIFTFGKDKKAELKPDRIPMPDLEENQKVYDSKMEALDAIEEERETTAPQIYPDHMVDDKGYFNPDYMEYEKQRIIDSLYKDSKFEIRESGVLDVPEEPAPIAKVGEDHRGESDNESGGPSIRERARAHDLFFASGPKKDHMSFFGKLGKGVLAYVDGDQTIRDGYRLDLRLGQDILYNGVTVPKNTRLYGFVKVRPNRVMVDLAGFGDLELSLKVHDHQDGQEGIYVENHMKGEVVESGLNESIDQVNVPGLPQIGGLKRIFQRHNRAVKVDIKDNYQLMLKQEL